MNFPIRYVRNAILMRFEKHLQPGNGARVIGERTITAYKNPLTGDKVVFFIWRFTFFIIN
jgi:hypothetical protein